LGRWRRKRGGGGGERRGRIGKGDRLGIEKLKGSGIEWGEGGH